MLQAVEDAKLTEADYSNPGTGLYAASAGSPFLLGHHLERMRKVGVMRCPPLGVVASISGTVNFNLVSQFSMILSNYSMYAQMTWWPASFTRLPCCASTVATGTSRP